MDPNRVSHAADATSALHDLYHGFGRSRCNSCSSPSVSTEFEMPDCWEHQGDVTFLDEQDLQEALLLMGGAVGANAV
jgi:hypothetical protein